MDVASDQTPSLADTKTRAEYLLREAAGAGIQLNYNVIKGIIGTDAGSGLESSVTFWESYSNLSNVVSQLRSRRSSIILTIVFTVLSATASGFYFVLHTTELRLPVNVDLVFGLWCAPAFFGALGASIRHLRFLEFSLNNLNSIPSTQPLRYPVVSALIGAFIGTNISLLFSSYPLLDTHNNMHDATYVIMIVAFVSGYFYDILLSLLDKLSNGFSGRMVEGEWVRDRSPTASRTSSAPVIVFIGILIFLTGVAGMTWTTVYGGDGTLHYAGLTAVGAVAVALSLLSGRRSDGESQEGGQQWSAFVSDEDVRSAGGDGISISSS